MRTAKVCVLGDFAVGKTSTVARFVTNEFSAKYLTTVGVKIDTKTVDTERGPIKLIIWDVAGSDTLADLEFAYLRGSAGFVLVADGTRPATVDNALRLRADVRAQYGELPFVALLNKADLSEQWRIDEDRLKKSAAAGIEWVICSAKTGEGVGTAIELLAASVARNQAAEQ